jgi:hypothetical protein
MGLAFSMCEHAFKFDELQGAVYELLLKEKE